MFPGEGRVRRKRTRPGPGVSPVGTAMGWGRRLGLGMETHRWPVTGKPLWRASGAVLCVAVLLSAVRWDAVGRWVGRTVTGRASGTRDGHGKGRRQTAARHLRRTGS